MTPVIFMRPELAYEDELRAAEKYFRVVDRRTAIPSGSLVIPRYAALPYNKELCEDVQALGSTVINSNRQHNYVADLSNWYCDIGEYTPRTWFALDQIPDKGPFVLKGQTNSIKRLWNTHCYAEDKHAAIQVYQNLANDGYIGHQQIYIRQFVPLKNLGIGLNGLPISEEYRFFVLDGKVLASGFYWASMVEEPYPVHDVPQSFLDKVISLVQPHVRFWVMDIAKTETREWIVVELNDGQQSGLSAIDPEQLYRGLHDVLILQ